MNHYQRFYDLHHNHQPFILANAWNAKSAQVAEAAGFEAIGTSSGAIAESLGYPDGEHIPFEELLYIVRRIKTAIHIPLSVDIERGYTNDLDQLNDNIQQLLDIGVAGINIEDAQGEDIYVRKLRSIKDYLVKTKQQLFINARTDGFLQKVNAPLDVTIKRAAIYRDAGADGLFVTGVPDADILQKITTATTLPVNVVATPKLSSFTVLTDCGVKRISMAAFLYKSTYKHMEAIAGNVKNENAFSNLY